MAAETALGRQVVRSVSWRAAAQIVRQVTRIAVMVVLARALTPAEYGLAGMVIVFSTLILVFADLGLGAPLVQRTDIDELDKSTVFWTSLFAGGVFTAIGWLLAAPLAAFYGEPEVAGLFRGLSLSFFITSLGITQTALLTRDLRFKELGLRNMVASVAGAIAGISLAVSGAGAWSIIGQQLAVAVSATVLLWSVSGWRPRFAWSWTRLKAIGGYGLNVFTTRFSFYLERNSDNLLIGKVLGAQSLGLYSLAYTIMLLPLEQIGGPIAEVLFPALSRLQNDLKRLGQAWLKAVRVLAAVVFPTMLFLVALAPDAVVLVFGEQWTDAVPIVQILAWVGLHQSLQRFNSSVLQAVDKTNWLVRYALISLAVNVPAFALGLQWGAVGVAACYAISSTLVAPIYLVMTTRAAGLSVRSFFMNLVPIAGAAVLAAATAGLLRAWLASGPLTEIWLRLPLCSVVAISLYLLFLWRFEPEVLRGIGGLIPQRHRARMRRLVPGAGARRHSIVDRSRLEEAVEGGTNA